MSDLTSILASTFLPETPSLNNSQTLIASGNIANSRKDITVAEEQEILKTFGNYRPLQKPETVNYKIIMRASQFTTASYVPAYKIKAIYLANKGLVPQSELSAYVTLQDKQYIQSDRQDLINPDGFIRVGMILNTNNKISYLFKGAIGYIHDPADTYPAVKNPQPLLGQASEAVSKPEPKTTSKSDQKPDPTTKSPEPTGAQAAAAAANKPGAPAADTKAPVSDTPVFKLSEKFDPAANFFRIIYADAGNSIKSFVFTFLPARETKIGNWNVPEARTGVPIQTKMRHKMQVVPGAGPIVQTIGINGTTVTLVGALLGNEVIAEDFATGGPNSRPIYASSNKVQGTNTYAEGAYPGALPSGAYDKALELQRRLVYPGRPVTIEIKPSSTQATFQMKADGSTNKIGDFIRMTGVITAIRLQHAHSDRCYYALDLFVTEYPEAPAAKPNTEQVLKAANSKYLGPTIGGRPDAIVRAEDDLEELKKSKTLSGVKIDGRPAEIVRAENKLAEIKKKFDVTIDGRPASLVTEEADKPKKDYAKIKAKLTAAQKAQLKKILELAPKEKKELLEKNYLDNTGLRASLDTRLGIDEGIDYAEQLANANPEAASESSAIAADYLATIPTNQAPVGLSIASISEQLSNNIQAAATSDSVLSAISNATAGTLRPAQQKAALEQIASRTDLDPTQINYLTDAIGRYAA
jgi:hypothetical protein